MFEFPDDISQFRDALAYQVLKEIGELTEAFNKRIRSKTVLTETLLVTGRSCSSCNGRWLKAKVLGTTIIRKGEDNYDVPVVTVRFLCREKNPVCGHQWEEEIHIRAFRGVSL